MIIQRLCSIKEERSYSRFGNWIKGLSKSIGGMLKKLSLRFKHPVKGVPIKGKVDKSHKIEANFKKTKRFSDISTDLGLEEYCKLIPGYQQLWLSLSFANMILLDNISFENKKFICDYFPSLIILSSPDQINKYRQDYMSDIGIDMSEILFTFGDELVYGWNFDQKAWCVQDRTYNPAKEWRISDNSKIFNCIAYSFDPDHNTLLQQRINVWEGEGNNEVFNMREYCNVLRDLLMRSKINSVELFKVKPI